MKVLVTGVSGFVGSSIAKELLQRGHLVVGLDSVTDYYDRQQKMSNLESLRDTNMEFVQGDINQIDVESLLWGVEVIYHQAGQPGVRKSWGNHFQTYTRQNVDATQRLLEASKSSSSLTRFVYASSSSVYGNATHYPVVESDLPSPVSPYGVTKLAAEHLCVLYATEFGVPTVSLRYFTVYGPRQRPDMAFSRFVRASITGERIEIYGDGEQIRDFTYIDDVVEANMLAAERSVKSGSVLNICGGGQVTINQALEILNDIRGKEMDVVYIDSQPGDVRRTAGSNDLARAVLGWDPRVGITEGLFHHREWMRGYLETLHRPMDSYR